MSKYPIFRHYLEDEDDKPYYTMNSLSFYYEDMERKQKLIESLAKSIAGYDIRLTENLETIEKEVERRLADWDKQLEKFPDSVEGLLSKWSTDGTIDTVIQTALIDEKIAPVTAQLADTTAETVVLEKGVHTLEGDARSLTTVEVEGRTLNNLLGRKGRTHTEITVPLEAIRQYVLFKYDSSGSVVSFTKHTNITSLTVTRTAEQRAALYDVNNDTYIAIGSTWTGATLTLRFPYVDDIKHVNGLGIIEKTDNENFFFADLKIGATRTNKEKLFRNNGRWFLTKHIEKDIEISGSRSWVVDSNKAGFLVVHTPLTSLPKISVDTKTVTFTKSNGDRIYRYTNTDWSKGDEFNVNTFQNRFYVTISDADTGFADAYTPTVDELKAYFNGWKVKTANATTNKPMAWLSVVDGVDSPTQTLAYVSTNKAVGYTPYKVSYEMTSSDTVDVSEQVIGQFAVEGATTFDVDGAYRQGVANGLPVITKGSHYDHSVYPLTVAITYSKFLRGSLDDTTKEVQSTAKRITSQEKQLSALKLDAATKDYVTEEIVKVNTGGTVDISTKADTSFVNTELGKKADISYVDTSLANVPSEESVQALVANKAEVSYVNEKIYETEKKITVRSKFKPIVSFLSDDGFIDDYNIFKPITIDTGVPFSLAIVSNATASDRLMAPEHLPKLHELVDVYGYEVVGHTSDHERLGTISYERQLEQIAKCRQQLDAAGFEVHSLAYPYGNFNADTLDIMKDYFEYGYHAGTNFLNDSPIEPYQIARIQFDPSNPNNNLEWHKAKVDEAVAGNKWVIFMLHCDPALGWMLPAQQQMLRDLIAYIQSLNVEIKTCHDAYLDFKNIYESDDGRYAIGAKTNSKVDGQLTLNVFNLNNQPIKHDTPRSGFPTGISYKNFVFAEFQDSLPGDKVGTLMTANFGKSYNMQSYQEYRPYNSNTIYRRRCNSDDTWTVWV